MIILVSLAILTRALLKLVASLVFFWYTFVYVFLKLIFLMFFFLLSHILKVPSSDHSRCSFWMFSIVHLWFPGQTLGGNNKQQIMPKTLAKLIGCRIFLGFASCQVNIWHLKLLAAVGKSMLSVNSGDFLPLSPFSSHWAALWESRGRFWLLWEHDEQLLWEAN